MVFGCLRFGYRWKNVVLVNVKHCSSKEELSTGMQAWHSSSDEWCVVALLSTGDIPHEYSITCACSANFPPTHMVLQKMAMSLSIYCGTATHASASHCPMTGYKNPKNTECHRIWETTSRSNHLLGTKEFDPKCDTRSSFFCYWLVVPAPSATASSLS